MMLKLYICVYLDSVSIGCGPDSGSPIGLYRLMFCMDQWEWKFSLMLMKLQQFQWLELCAWDSDAFDDDRIQPFCRLQLLR